MRTPWGISPIAAFLWAIAAVMVVICLTTLIQGGLTTLMQDFA